MPKYSVGDTVFLNPKQEVSDEWPLFTQSMREQALAGMKFEISATGYNYLRNVQYYHIFNNVRTATVREEWITLLPPKKKPFTKRSRMY